MALKGRAVPPGSPSRLACVATATFAARRSPASSTGVCLRSASWRASNRAPAVVTNVAQAPVALHFGLSTTARLESPAGRLVLKERSYVRLYSKGDGFGNERLEGTSVTCSAYMVDTDHPLLKFSDRAYRVALSNHADFEETLAYVKATGAKTVVTDNTRNHGVDLAVAINSYLQGVYATPSKNRAVPS